MATELFGCLAAVREKGVPKAAFENLRRSDLLQYKWQFKTNDLFDTAMNHASELGNHAFESYPQLKNVLRSFDPNLALQLVKQLTPDTAQLSMLSPDWLPEAKDLDEQTEKWYGVKYKVAPIHEEAISAWESARAADYKMPELNEYIPDATDPKQMQASKLQENPPVYPDLPEPEKIIESPSEAVYLWRDEMYGNPWVKIDTTIHTDTFALIEKYGLPTAEMLADVFMRLIGYFLDDPSSGISRFTEAGLSCGVDPSFNCVDLTGVTDLKILIQGLNPVASTHKAMLKTIVDALRKAAEGQLNQLVDEDTFELVKQQTKHHFENIQRKSPAQEALARIAAVNRPEGSTVQARLDALENPEFTLQNVAKFAKLLLTKIHLQGFFAGQVTKDEAVKTWTGTVASLACSPGHACSAQPLAHDKMYHEGWRRLDGDFHETMQGHSDFGSAAVLVLDAGKQSRRDRSAIDILMAAISPDFYKHLRTEQQLGYLVQANKEELLPAFLAPLFIVQSANHNAKFLLDRFHDYLKDLSDDLKSSESQVLTEHAFKEIKAAKVAQFKNPQMDVKSTAILMIKSLECFHSDFQAMAEKFKAMKMVTYKDVIDYGQRIFGGGEGVGSLAILYSPPGEKGWKKESNVPPIDDEHVVRKLTLDGK